MGGITPDDGHQLVNGRYRLVEVIVPIIVMELLGGRSLADILKEEVPLPYRRVAEIGAAALEALREADGENATTALLATALPSRCSSNAACST